MLNLVQNNLTKLTKHSTMLFLRLLIIVISITKSFTSTNPYCNIKCDQGAQHQFCSDPECKVKSPCYWDSKHIPLTKADKVFIVQEHNKYRKQIAEGAHNYPKAQNMQQLRWDNELGKLAQCWANVCVWEHTPCTYIKSGKYYGQNLAMKGTSGKLESLASQATTAEHIAGWFNEISLIKDIDGYVKSYSGQIDHTGHFTQMIWGNSQRIGCGRIFYNKKGMNFTNLVCNYFPGGNIIGRPIYEVGSGCTNGVNKDGLCAKPNLKKCKQ